MRSIGAQLVAMSDSELSFHELLLLAVCRERERFSGRCGVPVAAETEASELRADLEPLIRAYEAALRRPQEGIAVDTGPDLGSATLIGCR